jgi:hypothetical protein
MPKLVSLAFKAATALIALTVTVAAQEYPAKPIRGS